MRSLAGTNSGPASLTERTKRRVASRVAPSRQLASSVVAAIRGPPPGGELSAAYSRLIIASASRSRSTYSRPETSTTTRWIVPPTNAPGSAARVVVGDGLAAVPAHVETFTRERELARLSHDLALADLL